MRIPYLWLLILLPVKLFAGELTGYVALDNRLFFEEPQFDEQRSNNAVSFVVEPEYYHVSKDEKDTITFRPFVRYDYYDSHRTHVDFRQFDWLHVGGDWELRAGFSKVFWGVAESNHLIDIINQTDVIEDIDGEDKFGQPMVQYAMLKDWGTLRLYYLPYFRERIFASQDGRLRSGQLVEYNDPIYDNGAKEWHPSFAARYENVLGDWDVGIGHFSGVGRDPRFQIVSNVYVPVYDVIEQSSVDLQLTTDSWLWKFEAIGRSGQGDRFYANVFGGEYTLYSLFESDLDCGLISEYSYDGRDENTPATVLDNDIFFGSRLTFNYSSDTEMLAGIFFDDQTQATSYAFEMSTRYGNRWKLELDVRIYGDAEVGTIEAGLEKDSHAQLRIARYF